MRLFGLIGYPLGHSFSKPWFNAKFEREAVNAYYENYPLTQIDELSRLLAENPGLEGLNVTIPYKEAVIPYLDVKSDVVEQTGACNCIRIRDGKLEGFNTDVVGFEKSLLKSLGSHHSHALVLGTGGASKAVQYVLRKLRIPFIVISRKSDPKFGILSYDQLNDQLLKSATLWINTTPLGMYPNVDSCPPMNYSVIGDRHYLYDLVYNPSETLFLRNGKAQGAVTENGHDMLVIQAEEGWKIWNQ